MVRLQKSLTDIFGHSMDIPS